MRKTRLNILVLLALILAACTTPTGTPVATPEEETPVPTEEATEIPVEESIPTVQAEEPLYFGVALAPAPAPVLQR